MKPIEALKHVVANSGLTKTRIAEKAGKNKLFVNSVFRGENPTANNTAALLNACGYNLCLIKPEDAPESAIRITMKDE